MFRPSRIICKEINGDWLKDRVKKLLNMSAIIKAINLFFEYYFETIQPSGPWHCN